MEVLLHALSLYGAAGIAAFGWAVCRLLDWSVEPWILLWSCAALLIYNADRLRPDPADLVNIPQRAVRKSASGPVEIGAPIRARTMLDGPPPYRWES